MYNAFLGKPQLGKLTAAAVLSSACLIATTPSAWAEVVVGGNNGWEVGFDGSVNGFLVSENSDERPAGTVGGIGVNDDRNFARIRTGLLPAIFGFNVRSPMVNGLRGSARVGFYPQIQNSNTKNEFGSQVDLREAFFKVEGNFGEVLIGRAMSIYQSKNLLTDMTLFGVGVQGPAGSGGTTLGRIGYGYIYSNFNAGMRYTTPSYNGFQATAAIYDPSIIAGDTTADETSLPRFEAELSYANRLGAGSLNTWLSGMTQEAEFSDTENDVRASGLAFGIQYTMDMGLDLLVSGYTGDGLGSFFMLDTDSLDAVGEERENDGFILQSTYTYGSTKFGLSYGESNVDETDSDKAIRLSNNAYQIDKQSAIVFGVYHDVTDWLKLVGEFTHATNEWHGTDEEQDSNIVAIGAFFIW